MSAIQVIIDSNTKKAESIKRIIIDAESEDTKTYNSDDGKAEYLNNNF